MAHHDHSHSHAAGAARRPLLIALAITGSFLVVEVVGALVTGSLALLADAGHMLTDVAALVVALLAVWIATRPATPQRTYGYRRAEVLAALVNAASLVAVSLYVFWEALERLGAPPEVDSLPMLGVASAGLVANVVAAWVLSRGAGDSLNVRAALLHVLGDLLGSVGALAAAVVMLLTGWYYADPIASVLIGLFVLHSGWRLLGESVDVLLEATPRHIPLRDVEAALGALPGVAGTHDLHVWSVTSGFVAMSGHLTVDGAEHGEVLIAATSLLRERFGIAHATLQLEAPALEPRLHHGCYVADGATGCAVAIVEPECAPTGHRH